MGLLIYLFVGAVAGWLAGLVMKGGGFGLLVDIIVGIVGGVIGGWIFGKMGVAAGGGMIGSIVVATVGAIILLFIIRLFKKG
jgi:uncharacterized membrane protein YeaQ/YmgE (transglycosylase-associated protein family)